ncbi:hypothetical protein NUU61_004234 [Penicillium alfredii]|uniref:Sodium/calcium exchanger membrane region domain-containing protein n=1 Tax=Penicillium alfredii TaxID=1506179 RepID=A0A9W9FKU1_9EURO|nr:uncharacterized protein NUU61_004234 [Penicillium alfredii]KAJ5102012.1 hypothetical protein NUU61_004234 [Penicillium alfredii]
MLSRDGPSTDPLLESERDTPNANVSHKEQSSWLWSQFQGIISLPTHAGLSASSGPVLVLLPLAALARLLHWNAAIILVVNLVAIIFLSESISAAFDELSEYLGELQGALLSATLGNTVELTIFGCCLVTASYNKDVLEFNSALAKTLSSLMMISAVTILLPTALYSTFSQSEIDDKVLSFSRGTSFVLFALYAGYLYFYLGSHKHLFEPEPEESDHSASEDEDSPKSTTSKTSAGGTPGMLTAIARLATAVAATALCTELLFESIDAMVDTLGITKVFIAVILIPIASNSTEGIAVIAAARSSDTDSAIRVIIDSLLQIGLFVIPFLVIMGWCIEQPMTLFFDSFQTVLLFLAVLVVNHLLRDGQYAYIHGAMLISL